MRTIELVLMWTYTQITTRATTRDERGIGTLEIILIAGAVAAMALLAMGLLRDKVLDAVDAIQIS